MSVTREQYREMNFVNCGYSMAFIICYVAVVLVIVNGQSTTDYNTENGQIAQLRAELAHLTRQLAVSVDKTANLERQLSALSDWKSDRGKFTNSSFEACE